MKNKFSLTMKLSLVVVILFLFTNNYLSSQNLGPCGYVDPQSTNDFYGPGCENVSDAWINKYRPPGYWIPDENTPIKTILVNWVICRDDNGENGWQDIPEFHQQVDLMFTHINERYSNSQPKGYALTCEPSYTHVYDTRIRFELNEIIFIDNTDFNSSCYATDDMFEYLETHHPDYKIAMNHFFTQNQNCSYWGRYDNNDLYKQSWVLTAGSMYHPSYVVWDDHIGHIVHEYGHAVGQHHTYDGEQTNISHYDFLDDVFGLCPEPLMMNPANPCFDEGGLPCSPTPGHICYLLGSCFFQYFDPPYPLMSGMEGPKIKYISPKSAGRMHRALSCYENIFRVDNMFMHKYVKEQHPSEVPLTITEDETWDFAIKMYQDIVITAENTLKITCEVRMPLSGKIIVEPGGKLVVDGGTITCAHNGFWGGIQVWGDATAHQYTINGQCAQGQVILKNGAVIENANVGILLGKTDSSSDGYDDDFAGGIVKVEGNQSTVNYSASIINCFSGVIFRPYQNFNPFSSQLANNLSYFSNTRFEANEDYNSTTWVAYIARLNGVNGIKFNGCSFENSQSKWGEGISAIESGFVVNDYCAATSLPPTGCDPEDIVPASFTNFARAVSAANSGSHTVSIANANFYNNSIGIKLTEVQNAAIISNEFYIAEATDYEQEQCGLRASGYGIWMDNCTGFAIEENYFTKATGAPAGNYTGIYVNSTQAADEIYKNYFEGLSYANYAEGKNWLNHNTWQGLAYYCNENTGNWQDITVADIPNQVDGIQNPIGSDDLPAGNTFSDNANYNIYNNGAYWIGYFYYGNPGTPYYPDEVYRVIRSAVTDNQNECPSHYGGGGSGIELRSLVLSPGEKLETEQAYAGYLADYNNVKVLYNNLKDGGNTEATLEDVENSWPADMWELRAELLGKTPHLSMEVLKATADKTDVLPESIIFEIMAANPDERKKDELIKYLEDKDNPLPGYMIDILEQVATGTTFKTVLQKEMAHYSRLKTRAAHDMIRSLLNDTVSNTGELRNWLDNLGGKRADEQIIASYIQDGNYADALALAGMMPALYNYSDNELAEHDYYNEMLDLRINLSQQGRSFFDLDNTEVSTLDYIANNSKGTGGAQARGILESAYGYEFCNCLNVSDTSAFKSSSSFGSDSFNQAFGAEIDVKPNPASDWVSFNFVLPDHKAEGYIKVSDVSGKIVETFTVSGKQGQKIWDTRKTDPGIYLYIFTVNGISISGKLIINK
jgi:hypothetical protein